MTSPPLRLAAAQIAATEDPVANLSLIVAAAERAAAAGCRIVVFPEASMACFGTRLAAVAQPLDGPFATGVREVAARLAVTLVVGMFTPARDGRVHNTLLLTGPDGEARYDKIHLYDAFGGRESDTVAAGDAVVTVSVAGTTVGLATCYDLRFAAHFTQLGRLGAQLVLVPASWGDGPGKAEQWDLLTRARAMDAQAYLLACGMAWRPPLGAVPLGIGRSQLADPLGGLRGRLGHEEGLLIAEADLSTVPPIRDRVPIL